MYPFEEGSASNFNACWSMAKDDPSKPVALKLNPVARLDAVETHQAGNGVHLANMDIRMGQAHVHQKPTPGIALVGG